MKNALPANQVVTVSCVEKEPLTSILNAISDAIIYLNNRCEITFWNDGAQQLFGIKEEDILGLNFSGLFPDPNASFLLHAQDALQQKKHKNFVEYCPARSILLDVSAYPTNDGLAILIKKANFTQQAENKLMQELIHKDVLINGTNDLIWSLNEKLQIVSFNNSFKLLVEKYLGRSIKRGEFFFEILSGTTLYKKWTIYFKKVLSGQSVKFDQTGIGFGSAGFLEVTLQPLQDIVDGRITGVACYAYDISKHKSNERIIRNKNIQLQDKERSLCQLSTELQTVLNASLDIICSINVNGELVRINNASKNTLDFSPAEMVGKKFINFLDEIDKGRADKVMMQIRDGANVTDFRCTLIKKDGAKIPFTWSARWDGKENMMFAIGRDASALNATELLKTESEMRFSALIQKGADMIGIVDMAGNYSYASSNVERILGYKVSDLIGKNVFAFIHDEDKQKVANELTKVIFNNEVRVEDFRFKNSCGEWRWIEVIGTNMMDNSIIKGIVINSRDITERKQAEDELRKSNERFKIVSKATNEAIWDFNISTGEMNWNENYTKMLGYENLKDQNLDTWKSNVHPNDVDRVWAEVASILENNTDRYWKSEYRYKKANGDYAYIFDQGYIIVDSENNPVRFVGAMQDFTVRKKIEEEKEVIIKELIKSNNNLKQFSFITSHNLRAPLSNILGILQLLDTSGMDDVNIQLLNLINTSALQLQETIKDLSDIIVIRNQSEVKNEIFKIENIFENICKIYLNTIKDISYSIKTDFHAKEVLLHKPYVESIFINLVSNAGKYRSSSRPLELSIITFSNEQDELVIKFSDNGMGLDTLRLKDRLFGLYQRFHDHTEGKGLGLFIVKSQVIAMGGSIALESEEDRGTTFTIIIPNAFA